MLFLGIIWPVEPTQEPHPIGNSWGEYQNYSGDTADSYLHPGVDVMGITQGRPVYAVAAGWVKAWMTIYGDYHWRIATSDQNTDGWSDGWLYAHIDPYRWHAQLGDAVQEGDLIGYLVPWPVPGFDHLHFARIRHQGSDWNDGAWQFIYNPLLELEPCEDTFRPKIEDAGVDPSCFLAFKVDDSELYLSSDSLFGQVDVVLKAYDSYGISWGYPTYERIGVYQIEWRVDSGPWVLGFVFKDTINPSENVHLIYNWDSRLQTCGDYSCRQFYYIITNTDGWGRPVPGSWNTATLPDGAHWFVVRLTDEAGNQTLDSCLVYTYNGNSRVSEGGNLAPQGPVLVYDAAGRFLGELGKVRGFGKPGVYFLKEGRRIRKVVNRNGRIEP